MKRTAFSLIELSIVLVILGLLVGGILAGQSLIRASELRAVGAEYQRWMTATNAFRDKYFALPGDMTNATSFWGANGACPNSTTTMSTPTATCNGNGDGNLNNNSYREIFRYWQHLANAGLIEGNYIGVPSAANSLSMTGGVNVPSSKVTGAIWGMREWYSNLTNFDNFFNSTGGNMLQLGAATAADNKNPVLKPEEAWNIDTKLDDGMPGVGKVAVRPWGGNCNTATSAADMAAAYSLSEPTVTCTLILRQLFNQ